MKKLKKPEGTKIQHKYAIQDKIYETCIYDFLKNVQLSRFLYFQYRVQRTLEHNT